jgi:hypothetical protein
MNSTWGCSRRFLMKLADTPSVGIPLSRRACSSSTERSRGIPISNQGWFRLAMDAEAGLRERDPRRAEGGCLDRAAGERLHGF